VSEVEIRSRYEAGRLMQVCTGAELRALTFELTPTASVAS
jgi:hypothetical protein